MLPAQVSHFEKQRSRVLCFTSEPFATTIYETTALKIGLFIFFPVFPLIQKFQKWRAFLSSWFRLV